MKAVGSTRKAFTIAELSIALTIMGLLVAMAIPIFTQAMEQARLDTASRQLMNIWSAQRVYWLSSRSFADDLAVLYADDLISSKILDASVSDDLAYAYSVDSASASAFSASARRQNSSKWSGTIFIDQTGTISGSIGSAGRTTLYPISGD